MKTRIILYCYITLIMASLSNWVSVTSSRPFSSQDRNPHTPQGSTFASTNVIGDKEEEEYRALSRLGSRPPNCGHKCGSCYPCDPVQTPATTDRIEVQIANYEPEGWKCKCGLSLFNP